MVHRVSLTMLRFGALSIFVFMILAIALVARAVAAPPPPLAPVEAPDAVPLIQVDTATMPRIDNAALLAEEFQRAGPGVAPHFAQRIPVSLSPANSGTWETLPDGSRLWRLRIQSPGAVSLNLGFTGYFMPPGGRLLLYTPDHAVVRGPFTAADNETHGQFWTPIIAGDEMVVEVTLPAGAEPQLRLELGSVNHGFVEFGKAPLSGACNVDVVCSAANGLPQVDTWRDQIRAVAAISAGGDIFCSGFLVNNTANDRRPYFITAYHCGITEARAPSLVVYWNYENATCRQPGSPASGGPGDGALSQFNTGSVLRAAYFPSDFTLVELDDPIDPGYNVFWAGWDARPGDPTSATGIHHPNGEEKRISFEDDPLSTTSYLGASSPGDGSHLRVSDWNLGTTEGGSSGSPLFNQDGRIVGQLHGGYAACGNDDSDWYGRFSVSWSGGGTPRTRLRDWLDPLGTGALVWDGQQDSADFGLQVTPPTQEVCAPQSAGYAVDVRSYQGFATPVVLSVPDGPAGVTADFSPNPVTPPGASQLTIDNTAAAAPGRYTIGIKGVASTAAHTVTVGLDVFAGKPAAPILLAPADGANGVSTRPVFTWATDPNAASYDIQVAADVAFADIVQSATGVMGASWQPASDLAENTTYFWRVRAANACGVGAYAAAWRFTTRAGPGQCSPGSEPRVLYSQDFEAGAPGWSHSGQGDSWNLSSQPVHGGAFAYQAIAFPYVTDQVLVSPPIALPNGQAPLTLAYWNYRRIESGASGCFDGSLLEISADDGRTWTQLEAELLTDPYDGLVSSLWGNPLAGRNAWCGAPQGWLKSLVELDAYAGQTIRLRFRLGTDRSLGAEGWTIDDLAVQSCKSTAPAAQIDVAPATMDSSQPANTSLSQLLTLRNVGTAPLIWQITARSSCSDPVAVPWLSATPISGTITPEEAAAPVVTFDSTGLPAGTYSAGLCIASNDPDAPLVVIPVTMTVIETSYRYYLPLLVQ